MTKPKPQNSTSCAAALKISAACIFCLLLVFGLLCPASLSFAAEETGAVSSRADEEADSKALAENFGNVAVEPPSEGSAPSEAEPKPGFETNPAVPGPADPPAVPSVPEYDNAWPIGADDVSTVKAELWSDGTFVVDGAGAALAFDNGEDVPWLAAGVADDIERVIFADKVEAESLAHWFEGCSNLSEFANVPAAAKDLTRTFYDCPKLVELPDELEFSDDAILEECFGLAETGEDPLATIYRGADENVLAYAWEADGRTLVSPDTPKSPAVEQPGNPEVPADEPTHEPAGEPKGDPAGEQSTEAPTTDEEKSEPAAPTENAVFEPEPDREPAASVGQASQINITIPSSVSMKLGQDNPNSATIPVFASNRSECTVAITGARLKRTDMELSGGSWTLASEDGATTFVQNARFTPLGLEVAFDRPVILAAGDRGTQLVWHGSFTDYGMKKLLGAVAGASDTGFTYGSMIWIVSADS